LSAGSKNALPAGKILGASPSGSNTIVPLAM
jgi:hypothetical protein